MVAAVKRILLLAALAAAPPPALPALKRPVAPIVSSGWSTEASRDHAGEAARVIRLAGVRRGMRVADVGAGDGYYTLKLAAAVGPRGEVIAEDIMPGVVARLKRRAAGLGNVRVTLGSADDPRLPGAALDRVFLIHMYHEIEQPYALMWQVHDAMKPDGLVVIVDNDRATAAHGTPPGLLRCELAAVGFQRVSRRELGDGGGYVATFRPVARPAPQNVRPCYGRE